MSCPVSKYIALLSHELIRYDMATSAREAKRGRVNIYRMGLLMQALHRVEAEVGSSTGDSDADRAKFRLAMMSHFEPDFSPVKKVVKQLEAGTCKIK